jgi:formylmethanofuran dehydrogenase subunit B
MAAEALTLEDVVCPFCSLACDDLAVTRTERGGVALIGPECPLARTGYIDSGTGETTPPRIDGRPVSQEAAAERAAALIDASAAPLISGLATDVDGVREALALADACGAAVDHLHADGLMRLLLPMIDRGTVQTTLSEMRNRADLVLVFGPDPRRIAPRLFERTLPASGLFLSPEAQREIVFLAGQPEAEFADHCRVDVILAPSQRIGELAGALLLAFTKGSLPRPVIAGIPAGRLTELAQRMRQAQYGIVVFAPGLIDRGESDLAISAILHLVQELNRVNRWSALPVAAGDGLTGASQTMLWQSGLPLRSRFTLEGPNFAPRRLATLGMLAAGEADLLIWISAFRPIPPPETEIPVVAITHSDTQFRREPAVVIPVGVPGVDHGGAVFRTDGLVALPLQPLRSSPRPSIAAALAAIRQALPEPRP